LKTAPPFKTDSGNKSSPEGHGYYDEIFLFGVAGPGETDATMSGAELKALATFMMVAAAYSRPATMRTWASC
jgi:hypothetical protein